MSKEIKEMQSHSSDWTDAEREACAEKEKALRKLQVRIVICRRVS